MLRAGAEDPTSIRRNPSPGLAEWLECRTNAPAGADRPLQNLPLSAAAE
jgi:hypothetical protein